MVTCIEVANKAGVSRQTVSRVINNSPNVAESTRNRVLKAIEELSYHPNKFARALKVAKSYNIGFIISDPQNPFYIKIASSLQSKLSKNNYNLLLLFANENTADEGRFFSYMYEQQVDLVLFTPSNYSDNIERIIKVHQTPVIQLFRKLYNDVNSIKVDDSYGAYLATCNLLKSGHKRILLIEPSHEFDTGRVEGFKNALCEYGVTYEDWMYLALPLDPAQSKTVLENHFQTYRPTAMIPVSKAIETEVLNLLDSQNIKLHDKISIVFYDDNEIADILKISAISHNIDNITDLILNCLLEYIENPEKEFHEVILPEFLPRNSD